MRTHSRILHQIFDKQKETFEQTFAIISVKCLIEHFVCRTFATNAQVGK